MWLLTKSSDWSETKISHECRPQSRTSIRKPGRFCQYGGHTTCRRTSKCFSLDQLLNVIDKFEFNIINGVFEVRKGGQSKAKPKKNPKN